MNEATSLALKCCIAAGIAFLVLGLVLSENEYGDEVMWAGLLILIISPFIGVLTTYSFLILEKDRKWVRVATVLTAIILVFLAAALLYG